MAQRGEARARTVFDESFLELERRCFRDADGLRRFKPFIWSKTRSLHNVTHLDYADCVQIILEIVNKGCLAFYRTQYEDLEKYVDINNTSPKRVSRAKFSTFIYRHVRFKYDSFMTQFFAKGKAFESGRLRTETIHKKIINGVETEFTEIGTTSLGRFDILSPVCPINAWSDSSFYRNPEKVSQLKEFSSLHGEILDLVLQSENLSRNSVEYERIDSLAWKYGLSVRDFTLAIKGIFGTHDYSFSDSRFATRGTKMVEVDSGR